MYSRSGQYRAKKAVGHSLNFIALVGDDGLAVRKSKVILFEKAIFDFCAKSLKVQ